MSPLPQILLGLYLLFLVAAGWRLFGIGWPRWAKGLTAAMLTLSAPLLFAIPGMLRWGEALARPLVHFGLALAVCGVLCLASGVLGAFLRARRK